MLLLLCVFTSGCAGITFETVPGADTDAKVDGIRYYDAKPFLLVYSDGKGGLVSEVHFLPDLSQKRSADPYAFMASNEVTLTFSGGVLTQGLSVVDETVVPKAVIEAVATVGSALLKFMVNEAGAPPQRFPGPALFEIALQGETIVLTPVPVVSAEAFKTTLPETTLPDESKVAPPIRLKADQ